MRVHYALPGDQYPVCGTRAVYNSLFPDRTSSIEQVTCPGCKRTKKYRQAVVK